MLFGKKKCSNCNSTYDVVEDTCPFCHERDDNFEMMNIPKNVVWLPIYKQLLLFGLGFLLLHIISFIGQLIFSNYFEPTDVTYVLIINLIRYLGVAVLMAVTLIHSYPKFKNSFNKVLPYVVGVSAGIILIAINIAYNAAVGVFYQSSTNGNQSLANALVKTYPVIAIFLLGFVGPTVEELTYRVGLFTFLTRVHKAVAYAATIILFAIIHFDFTATGEALINEFITLPIYVICGAILCVLYDFMGLSSSLTAHIVNNLISTLPILLASGAE